VKAIVTSVIVALCVGVGVAAAIYWFPIDGTTPNLWHAVSWRSQIYLRKAMGDVPDLSWAELLDLTMRSGVGGALPSAAEGLGLEGRVTNPHATNKDHEIGARIFRERCAPCHGGEGTGAHGPSLVRLGFRHGDSDLSIYKVVRDGIPGTGMPPAGLSMTERWQVVAYVNTLRTFSFGRQVTDRPNFDIQVSSEQVRTAGSRPDEWLTYSGSLNGRRYSSLAEISPANVSKLRVLWVRQFDFTDPVFEATPIVAGGVIFTTTPPSNVVALEAKSGNLIWRYDRNLPANLTPCCGRVNRGLAVLDNMLFLGSLDGYLVALDSNDGKVIWQTQVANHSDGYTITGAPLIVNHSIVIGVSGGDLGVRGFLSAYDAATGKQLWKFYTIPGPGEFGHETWKNDAWETGGGATWTTGSYDPSLDLIYWGVGNPSPDFASDLRPGDNLFTDSVIALHASSGKLEWYFQFTPHDDHDWDSGQTPILADLLMNGVNRKVICWPNRNGFYYVLDRVTGEFLVGTPFVEQTWAEGLDSTGRPIPSDAAAVSETGQFIKPGVSGGTNWQPAAFDRERGLVFVPATEGESIFTKSNRDRMKPKRVDFMGSGHSTPTPITPVVRALDVTTGTRKWQHFSPPLKAGFDFSGLLATAGGLVFGASGEYLFALDASSGDEVWRVSLGGHTRAAPISFSVDGHQVIAVSAGRALFVFGL
jgi:alcohol dehydrogenase (cytochrome c)